MSDVPIRSRRGVVVWLRDLGDGSSKLIFDDVVGESEGVHINNPVDWSFERTSSWSIFPNEKFEEMQLSAQQYQEIGESLVARLVALNGRVK